MKKISNEQKLVVGIKKELLSAVITLSTTALVGIGGYVAGKVKDMSVSVTDLNKSVAALVSTTRSESKRLDSHEHRLILLERRNLDAAIDRVRNEVRD